MTRARGERFFDRLRDFDHRYCAGMLAHCSRSLRRWLRSRGADRVAGRDAIELEYRPNPRQTLALLCDRYGSDKGSRNPGAAVYAWPPHSYTDFYTLLFDHCRGSLRAVFECGIGTADPARVSNMGPNGRPGASLRVWRDYFPHATVVGADIDAGVLFQEERVRTHQVDQTCADSIARMWRAEPIIEFDLMIDDGLHTFEAGWCLFEHSHHRLAPHGIYVIEDVAADDLERYRAKFAELDWDVAFVRLERRGLPLGDNALVLIRRPSA